jgi:hypothetical protein
MVTPSPHKSNKQMKTSNQEKRNKALYKHKEMKKELAMNP